MTPAHSRHLRLLEVLEDLEAARNFLHEAPIDELEAVEDALGRNAPIPAVNNAIALVVQLAAEAWEETQK